MLKSVLVHIPCERLIRPVVDAAISLAGTRAARLDAVSVGYETANVALAIGGGAAVLRSNVSARLARANAALAVFEAEARNAGITYGVQALMNLPVRTATAVSASARLFDLTISCNQSRTETPSTTRCHRKNSLSIGRTCSLHPLYA